MASFSQNNQLSEGLTIQISKQGENPDVLARSINSKLEDFLKLALMASVIAGTCSACIEGDNSNSDDIFPSASATGLEESPEETYRYSGYRFENDNVILDFSDIQNPISIGLDFYNANGELIDTRTTEVNHFEHTEPMPISTDYIELFLPGVHSAEVLRNDGDDEWTM